MSRSAALATSQVQGPVVVNRSAASPTTRFLAVAGGRIAYDDAGTGPLVLMLPGLGDLRQEYRHLVPLLIAAGYRAVTMDLRGHGETSAGWADHGATALADDAVALLRHLDAGPAILIGTSMGAAAVAAAAAKAPERVTKIVLVGPFVRDMPPASGLKAAMLWLMIRIGLVGPWAPAAWLAFYDSLYPGRKPADHAAYRAALKASLGEPGRMAALRAMMLASKADVAALLPAVRAETLVVMGSRDPDFPDPEAEARTVAGLLRGRMTMIDGAGHYPHAELPEETARAILPFIAEGAR